MESQQRKRKRRKKKRIKKFILVIEIIIILALIVLGITFLVPNAKVKVIKALVSCSTGRSLVGSVIGDDYTDNIQDTDFNGDGISVNSGVESNKDYTNIALFGGDSREVDVSGASHGDSMIIVSINNKTGDIKMVSVYRDTVLKYTLDEKANYGKATNALYAGGLETAINMMNENLDLNITDYVMVNFAGLANIVDALGGIDVNITEDEMQWINNYLGETREVTGMTTLNVTEYGNVHLTGLQTTAYCRIRAVAFHQADGTELNNDYGRTARQRFVLEQILKSTKSAGVSELLKAAKTLFSQNSGEEKFISSSMSFDEVLQLLPAALESNIVGNQGFPMEYKPIKMDGSDCLAVQGLAYNAGKLHEYLFGNTNYQPSTQLQEINDKLIKVTGVKPASD